MELKSVEIAIIGGGQAGLALSYHLTALGRPHVILEQARAVESWRSKRWDSLRLIAPNWSLVLPGFAYPGPDPDGFMARDEVVEHLVGYARRFGAQLHEGVRVVRVAPDATHSRFVVRTEDGELSATVVVLATGALQRPRVPRDAAEVPASVTQLIPGDYRNPQQLPAGKTLIVGSGETGCQIAEDLARAGRTVFLSGGRSWWAPRRYRGRDIAAWLRLVGWFERLAADLPQGVRAGTPNPQLTGADGGHDINPHSLARAGVRLLGRLEAIRDGTAHFADDLSATVAWGDERARRLLRSIDDLVDAQSLDAPPPDMPDDLRRSARTGRGSDANALQPAPNQLDLHREGFSTIVWATGYRPDLGWVDLPIVDADGYPEHRRGVTHVPGLYLLGLDWLHTAKSGLFAGIGDDAGYLASTIVSRH